MWFVVPGHYGCLRAFKHKSFFVEGILKSEFMKHVYSIKYMSQMYHLEFGVAFTMFFIAPLTLSRHNKLTVSKTLPSSFAIKSTWLKSTLVICLSICRIERKKMQFGCLWVQNKISGSISKKESNLNSSNLEKRYQITILCLLSIFQTWDLKKKLGQDTRWPI